MKVHAAAAAYGSLAPRYLTAHLKRTLLTILGVVLSVALACASGLFAESLRLKGIENISASSGAFHAAIEDSSDAEREALALHARVGSTGAGMRLGVAGIGGYVLGIVGADEGYRESMHLSTIGGRLPEKAGEIALDEWLFTTSGRTVGIGDELPLAISLATGGIVRRAFTVTGFLEPRRALQASGIGMAVIDLAEAHAMAGTYKGMMAVFTIKKGLPIRDSIALVARDLGVDSARVHGNAPLLAALGESDNAVIQSSIRNIELILALVILAAAIAVISNTFGISVTERIRQFGLLRCVGATPAQVRSLVLREALAVSAVGIPMGIASGIFAVWAVIKLFFSMSTAVGGIGGMSLTLSPWMIAGSAALGLAAVFAAAAGPAIRAGRVPSLLAVVSPDRTPRDAVRRRRHRLASLLGVPGRMAARNLSRSPRRLVVTVASISIGIVLFITFSGFLSLMGMAMKNREISPFWRTIGAYASATGKDSELSRGQLDEVGKLAGVKNVLAAQEDNGRLFAAPGLVTDGYRDWARKSGSPLSAADNGATMVPAAILGLTDEGLAAFRTHIIEGVADPRLMDRENGVYLCAAFRTDKDRIVTMDVKIGDTLVLTGAPAEAAGVEAADAGTAGSGAAPAGKAVPGFTVLGFVDSMTESPVLDNEAVGVVTSSAVFQRITGKATFTRFDVELQAGTDSEPVRQAVTSITNATRGVRVIDYNGSDTLVDQTMLQISVLLYGLVAVIALIGGVNIVNTIGTSLLLRVREFGMLRAVGMTDRQLGGMIVAEGALYGLYASILGGAAGLALYKLIFTNIATLQKVPLILPWPSVAAACISALVIGAVSALVPLRRIGGMSVVESIRAEE